MGKEAWLGKASSVSLRGSSYGGRMWSLLCYLLKSFVFPIHRWPSLVTPVLTPQGHLQYLANRVLGRVWNCVWETSVPWF